NKLFMSSDEEDSDSQYSITFEHDCHDELIIDYKFVEVANDNKQEFNKQDHVNIEVNIENKTTIRKEKGKDNEEAQISNINTNTALSVLECSIFNSIQNLYPLHKGGICVYGTVHMNSTRFFKELKPIKDLPLDWNILLDKVVNNVLAIIWIDNGLITMLSTIHEISGNNSKIIDDYNHYMDGVDIADHFMDTTTVN
ncbi:7842_t:CDS:2, partial [Cetraspora pellucida]